MNFDDVMAVLAILALIILVVKTHDTLGGKR